MPSKYAGCTRVGLIPHAFNDLGAMAGMSKNLTFVDLDLDLATMKTSLDVVPNCHAVILVLTKPPGGHDSGSPPAPPVPDLGTVTFLPELRQIPDIYAFLHAVFNCGVEDATDPKSTLRHLHIACCAVAKFDRGGVLKRANGLQKAYQSAVKESIWGAQASLAVSYEPSPQPASQTASQTGLQTPPPDPPPPSLFDGPRFFVFVKAPTGPVVLIDEGRVIPIPNATPLRSNRALRNGVLTGDVAEEIETLRVLAGPGADSIVIGLTSRYP